MVYRFSHVYVCEFKWLLDPTVLTLWLAALFQGVFCELYKSCKQSGMRRTSWPGRTFRVNQTIGFNTPDTVLLPSSIATHDGRGEAFASTAVAFPGADVDDADMIHCKGVPETHFFANYEIRASQSRRVSPGTDNVVEKATSITPLHAPQQPLSPLRPEQQHTLASEASHATTKPAEKLPHALDTVPFFKYLEEFVPLGDHSLSQMWALGVKVWGCASFSSIMR